MFLLFYAILILCKYNATGADKEIFDRNVDDIFESILGDPHEIKRKMIERGRTYKWYEQTLPPNITQIFHSDKAFNHTDMNKIITTTTQKQIPVTPAEEINVNVTGFLTYYKFRLKKLEITRLLKEKGSPLPNFVKDQDNPAQITRRFDKLIAESDQTKTLYRRELYFDYQLKNGEKDRIFSIKTKMKDLMLHFIYVTRYKLPYMQLLRNKYKGLLKYQIGYCFALLRHLRQQQKNLYSALMDYYKMMNNLLIHMKIYEKVVRLDVDIRDVCKLIKVLNYKRQLEDDSSYYDDSPEGRELPPWSQGGPRGQGPTGPRSNEQKYMTLGGLPPGFQGRRAIIPDSSKSTSLSRRALKPDTPKVTSLSRRAIRPDTPKITSFSRRAIIPDSLKATSLSRRAIKPDTPKATGLFQSAVRTDTPDTLNKRNMQPPYHGLPMPPPPDPKPYEMKELGIISMPPLTPPPPTLRNGRRLYAPLPDGMRL